MNYFIYIKEYSLYIKENCDVGWESTRRQVGVYFNKWQIFVHSPFLTV